MALRHGFAFGFQRLPEAARASKAEESLEAGAYWPLDVIFDDFKERFLSISGRFEP